MAEDHAEIRRPSKREGFLEQVGQAADRLLRRWEKKHPYRRPSLHLSYAEDDNSIRVSIKDGGPK